jgi:hypothetical protein
MAADKSRDFGSARCDDSQGVETALRTLVTVGHSHPELRDALLALPPRIRAQRLVFLAALGQHAIQSGGLPARCNGADATVPGGPAVGGETDTRRTKLLDGFGGFGMD